MRREIIRKNYAFRSNEPYYMNNYDNFLIRDNSIETHFYIGKTLYQIVSIEYSGITYTATNNLAELVEHGGYQGEGYVFPSILIYKRVN